MKTLDDVLRELDKMDIEVDEIKITGVAFDYLVGLGEQIIATEADGEEEESQRNRC